MHDVHGWRCATTLRIGGRERNTVGEKPLAGTNVTKLQLIVASKKTKRPKVADVLAKARSHISSGRFADSRHAFQRKTERNISLPEITRVINAGYWEKKNDEWREDFEAWNLRDPRKDCRWSRAPRRGSV